MAYQMEITGRGDGRPRTETLQGEKTINARDTTLVKVYLQRTDVTSATRDGDDLVIKLADGSVIRLADYYDCSTEQQPEVRVADPEGPVTEWVFDPEDEDACGETAAHPVAWSFVPVTSDDGGGGIGIAPLVGLGALAVGGAIAIASGDDDDDDGSDGGDGGGDTTAPDPPVIDPTNGTVISGTAEAGSSIALDFDGDGNADATVDADGDGAWSYTPDTPLDDGTTISATATDEAGNTSDPATAVVDADTTAPAIDTATDDVGAITGDLDDGDATDDTMPTLRGSGAEPGATVSIFDGDTLLGTAVADDDGSWEFTPEAALDEGEHSFTVSATDALGNESAPSDPFVLTIDTTAPTTPTVDAGDGDEVTGTAEPGTTISIDIDGDGESDDEVTTGDDGTWTYTPDEPLDDGTEVTVVATDPAGNESDPASDTVGDDDGGNGGNGGGTGTPVIETVTDDFGAITGPIAEGGVTDDRLPTVAGSNAGASVTVSVYDGDTLLGTTTSDADGDWSFQVEVALAEGAHSLTAEAGGNSSEPFVFDVDTTAPAPPVIDDTDGSQVSGSAEPGSTVDLDIGDDGDVDETVTTDDEGQWSYTPDEPIPDDTEISATATDEAGNESDPATVTVDADAAPPAPRIGSVVDDVGAITGGVARGEATDDARPTIRGTAGANAQITVFDGATELGTATADASGNWAFTPGTDLGEGSHSFTATATSSGGTSGQSPAYAIVVDTVAPAAPVIAPTDGTEITGTAEPGATVSLDLDDDGESDVTVEADGAGDWTYTPPEPIEDGTTVTATASDEAGNVSPPATVEVDADTTAPPDAPTILAVTDDVSPQTGIVEDGGATNDTRPRISGSDAPAGATVSVYDGDTLLGTTTANGSGNWAFTPGTALGEGEHVFTVTASDGGGQSAASDAFAVVVDTTAPQAPTVAPSDGTEVTGTAEAGSTVRVDTNGDGTAEGTVMADASGNWSYTPPSPLADDTEVSARAVDAAGNVSQPGTATVDTGGGGGPQAPTETIEITAIEEDTGTVGDFATEDVTPEISGTLSGALDAGEGVEVRIDGGAWADAQVSGTTWSYAFDVIDEGDHTIDARVVGSTGLVGDTDSQDITIIDTDRAPIVQVSEDDLLGLIGAETLGLIDFNGQALFAVDPDNDLTEVEVEFAPLLSVNLEAYTLTADVALANSLGLSVVVDNDPGLLNVLAPSSTLTITAIDGGTMDNVAVNQVLGTVRYEQDVTVAGVQVLNATRITATDSTGLSDSDVVGNLVDISLLNGSGSPLMASDLSIKGEVSILDDDDGPGGLSADLDLALASSDPAMAPNDLLLDPHTTGSLAVIA
ncbi:Ig-like domain-containing protein [Novosphingobium sp. PC22D]|uniref:Ig-like domain-containing protein n=1 Tax=Novosphingobium sp. PC22D TaxID=1962403 RepID=UPI001145DB17|nr:Ig-like domain-containing protein [Novosphingobium sp. PC22D]